MADSYEQNTEVSVRVKAENLLTRWGPISWSRRTLLQSVS